MDPPRAGSRSGRRVQDRALDPRAARPHRHLAQRRHRQRPSREDQCPAGWRLVEPAQHARRKSFAGHHRQPQGNSRRRHCESAADHCGWRPVFGQEFCTGGHLRSPVPCRRRLVHALRHRAHSPPSAGDDGLRQHPARRCPCGPRSPWRRSAQAVPEVEFQQARAARHHSGGQGADGHRGG